MENVRRWQAMNLAKLRGGRVMARSGTRLLACLLGLLSFSAVPAAADALHPAGPSWREVPLPDQSDWSPKRRSGWESSVERELGEAMAIVEIPALDLAVPVFDSTSRPVLELGAGWVEGTALPGQGGNVALAGHRDSFFRPLEQIRAGHAILLATESGTMRYQVEEVAIVDPLDVEVLEPTEDAVLTLITCYPFRYVGFAPDRYIVRARLVTGGAGLLTAE